MRLKREHYLEQIRPYYEVDLIKVITGVRRSGKSILLETIRDELIERGVDGDHLIYLNLEDLDYEYRRCRQMRLSLHQSPCLRLVRLGER